MATFSLNSLPLEGDGVVENLFHYLWCKDELDSGPCINLPDTVIYKFRQPAYWYFTAKNGQIKKKSRYNLANIRIEEVFTRKVVGSDIVASYLSTSAESGQTTIEYFDRETFRDFLYNREKVDNGILQKFVEPKGTKNVMIRGIWSPKVVLLERRENLHHLTDTKFSLYERAVTYEGAEHFSKASPVRGSILPTSVQAVCRDVVEHVSEVSFRKCNISRMALNLKVDGEDRIWLLWCTSLRLERTVTVQHGGLSAVSPMQPMRQKLPSKQGPVSLFPHCQVPESVKKAFTTTKASRAATFLEEAQVAHGGPSGVSNVVPVELAECPSCCERVLMDRFYRVSYKTIVAHFEQFMELLVASNHGSTQIEWPPNPKVVEAVGHVGLGPLEKLRETIKAAKDKSKVSIAAEDIEVAPIIRRAHPHLSASDYRRFRRDPMFLYKQAAVCEECYLVFAQVASVGGTASDEGPLAALAGHKKESPVSRRLKVKSQRAAKDHIERASRNRRQERQRRLQELELKRKAHGMRTGGLPAPNTVPINKLREPSLPPRIDDRNIKSIAISRSQPVLQTRLEHDEAEEEKHAEDRHPASLDAQGVPEEFRQELVERENAFFRDLYRNPNLKHGHPLSHLISTQAKLAIAQAGTGTAANAVARRARTSKSKARLNKRLKPVLSPRELEGIDFSSPYAKSQIVPVLGGTGPPNRKRQAASDRAAKDMAVSGASGVVIQRRPSSSESQGASEHREFLLSTLERVQNQLANPMPLEQAVGIDIAADKAGELIQAGKGLDEALGDRAKALAATPSDLGRVLRSAINVAGERLMAAVDVHGAEFLITVFNPKLAVSQRVSVPTSVVLANAPPEARDSAQLARFLLDSLQGDGASDLFPGALSVKLPFDPS